MISLLKNILKYTFYFILCLLLLLSIAPYFFTLKNPELKAKTKPFENSNYKVKGNYFLHYRVFAPKKIENKIVMLHGFSGSTFSYHKIFDSLVNHNCLVVAVDIPPFGYSIKSKEVDYTDTLLINLIHGAMFKTDSLYSSKNKWIIAGHSLGVFYTSKMVSTFPDLFSKQIFIDGYYDFPEASGGVNKVVLYPPFMRLADVILEKGYLNEEKFGDLLESAYGRKAHSDEIRGYMQPFSFANSGSAVLKWASANQFIKVNKDVIYKKPTLVIWGKLDTWLPFKEEEFKLNLFKDISFKSIDSAGHIPMETHSDLVNKYLITFINN